jgi:hypothetical protein
MKVKQDSGVEEVEKLKPVIRKRAVNRIPFSGTE